MIQFKLIFDSIVLSSNNNEKGDFFRYVIPNSIADISYQVYKCIS